MPRSSVNQYFEYLFITSGRSQILSLNKKVSGNSSVTVYEHEALFTVKEGVGPFLTQELFLGLREAGQGPRSEE